MREDKNIHIVIGANFGDEGKGQMTDYFASKYDSSVVILSNGGAQRGHTVVTPEGARHVFHHFGSGSFVKGSKTYIPEYFVVNPVIFRQEREELKRSYNLEPIVYIHPKCLLTTIYDMLLNQAIEFDRAKDKHGSCGIGLYETLYRNHKGIDFIAKLNISPLRMTVKEFNDMSYSMKYEFLQYLRTWYINKRLNNFHLKHDLKKRFYDLATNENVLRNYIDDFEYMMKHSQIADYDILENENNIIFENGQGILLDQHNMDYFPHLSPSNTGLRNPLLIMQKMGWQKAEVCYVTRSYMTRHGAGRFDSECSKDMINKDIIDMTNVPNPFQDTLRYGYLDEKSLRHRIFKDVQSTDDVNFIYEIDVTLALTHVNEFNADCGSTYVSWGITRDNVAGGNLNFAFF